MNLLSFQHLSAKPFDDQQWIVNTDDGRNILINQKSFDLLFILKRSADEAEAYQKFKEHFKLEISQQHFENIVLKTFDQVIGAQPEGVLAKKSFLTLKITLLTARYAGLLASPFTKLFSQKIFWPIISAAFILNVLSLALVRFDRFSISPNSALLLSVLIGFSMPIHELGHIAACRKFGIKHQEIGFGFYLIFPIVYADITQIWNATKKERIIANLGGIYLELIYAFALFAIHFVLGAGVFLWAAVGVFLKAIAELNPFIRYDGYWLLSDISNTPNLMLKSKKAAYRLLSNLSKKTKEVLPLTVKEKLLAVYALSNMMIVSAYFVYVIAEYYHEILGFPVALYSLLIQLIHLEFSVVHFSNGFLWVLGLYVLTAKIDCRFHCQ